MGCVIPNEYQEVEYIESTGTQAILTDIPCQLPIKTDIDIMFTQSNDSYFCGTRYGDIRICSGGNYQNNTQWAFGTYKLTSGINLNTRYLLSTFLNNGNQSVIRDGDTIGTYEYTLAESQITNMDGNLALFAMWINNSQTFGQYAKAKCYGAKISNNNNLLGNFIPCYRKSDNEIGMYDTVSKQFFTNQGTGTFLKGNDVYHSNVFDLLKTKKKIIMNQPHVETLTGDVVSFTTDMKAPLKECKVSFMPVQEGSGDPSPTNVRNITGWNGVSVTRCGKNLFGGDALYQSYLANSNNKTVGEDENGKYIYVYGEASGATLFSDFKPNTQYTFISKIKRPTSMSVSGLRVAYTDGTWEGALTGNVTDGLGYLKWKTNKNKSVEKFHFLQRTSGSYYYYENFGIFEGDVNIEDYEPYNGATTPISWQSDYGTIYGGYVDLVKGELVAEYFGFVADGVNVAVNSGYVQSNYYGGGIVYFSRFDFPNGSRSLSDWYCDKLKPQRGSDYQSLYVVPNGYLYCVFYPFSKTAEETKTSAEAIEETNAWLQDNPTTVVYKLATPITYQLTPQQLITLKGQNNLWADTNGTTEIKFWKH